MSECRSCGKPILWAKTRNGTLAPFDREPDPDGLWAIVVTEGGEHAVLASEVTAPGLRYTSHFASCPDAPRWRR